MSYQPFDLPPGIVKSRSGTAAAGRYIDADKVRFEDGARPAKIGGWTRPVSAGMRGVCRGHLKLWNDKNAIPLVAAGTSSALYTITNGTTLKDITPVRLTAGPLSNPFQITNGSVLCTVRSPSHGASVVGSLFIISGATNVGDGGGQSVNGEFRIVQIIDGDTFTFELNSPAQVTGGTIYTGGTAVEITFLLESGYVDASFGRGYGTGGYGRGGYGRGAGDSSIARSPRTWRLDNYGSILLAMPYGGSLHQFDPNADVRASPVPNAPPGSSFFMTGERYAVVLGADDGINPAPMDIAWHDQNSLTDWTPTPLNTANRRRLAGGTRLMAADMLTEGLYLIWSNSHVFVMQFIGTRTVYSTRPLDGNAGIVGPAAYRVVNGIAYWVSNDGVLMYDGAIRDVPNQSDIKPVFLDTLNRFQREKIHAVYNHRFNEIWFFYPDGTNNEVSNYVILSLDTYSWVVGQLSRTAGGRTDYSKPHVYMTGPLGEIFAHEDGKDADGEMLRAYITSGRSSLNSGNTFLDVHGVLLDAHRASGDLNVTVDCYDYPQETGPIDSETVTIADGEAMETLRTGGRQIAVTLESNAMGGDFALSGLHFDVKPAGGRS